MSASGAQKFLSSLPDPVIDIFLWRKKTLSVAVPLMATATWVALDVYEFNFITVASWVALFIVTSLFLWGSLLRFLGKEAPALSGLEIEEQSAIETANTIREWTEVSVRWMFWVVAETEWFVFARTVLVLYLLSVVGSYLDLLTLLYMDLVVAMTAPVIYVKYEDQIMGCWECAKVQGMRRLRGMVDEKVLKKLKHKGITEEEKVKKDE